MRLSQQLTRYKKIASSILTKTKQSQRVSPNHQPHEAKSERPAPKKVKKPRSKTECKVCGKLVLHMAKHLKIHSVGRSHLCDLCGRSFLHRTSLNAHIRYNHKGVKRPKRFLCTQCNFACDSKFGLQTHERTHTGEKPFDCRYCDRKFSQRPALQRHIRTHTDEKPYSCNICGTSYTARSTYVMHYRKIHEKEKSDGNNDGTKKRRSRKPNVVVYCCESCPKKFHRKLAFERHCATHTGLPVAVRCGQLDCDFTYSDLHQLWDHMTKNHPDKTFSCSVCSKIFLSKWNLANHQSKHDDSLGFHCSYCPANLTTKSGLILHETIHTRDNPYECSVCKMRFHSPFLLKRHMCEHRPDQANRKRSRVAESAN